MKGPGEHSAYGSAFDLPSLSRMLEQVEGMKVATLLIARETRPRVLELEAQIRHLADVVDRFYELLGPRNWVFHEDLEIPRVEALVSEEADSAERALIETYKDSESLAMKVRRLHRFPGFATRMPLLKNAQVDFDEGRYYSTVNVLLSVMDGFVNDLEPAERRGLHARDSSELAAWDSVVGHHMGLAHAHETFKKTFRKVVTDEVTELYRNGIVHGMVVNYDNEIVAAKAWNRLFAVADWAASRDKQAKPPNPNPSLRETLKDLVRITKVRDSLERWTPSALDEGSTAFEEDEVVSSTRRYLDAWRAGNYGRMASMLSPLVRSASLGQAAGNVRSDMASQKLANYALQHVDHRAAAVACVDARLLVGETWREVRMRWIRGDDRGMGVSPIEPGNWMLMTWTLPAMSNERREIAARDHA